MKSNLPKSIKVINLFQRFQYRDILPSNIEEKVLHSKYKDWIVPILEQILFNRVPIIQISPVLGSEGKTSLLSTLKVCNDSSFSDERMKKIISLLQSHSSYQNLIQEISSPLHFQEAKFYSDLFGGCKFGFSPSILKGIIKKYYSCDDSYFDSLSSKIKWNLPKRLNRISNLKPPLFGEPLLPGFLFKLVFHKKKLHIYSEYGTLSDNCFPSLRRLENILPKDKVSYIDFVVESTNTDSFFSGLLEGKIISNIEIDPASYGIILLDFSWKTDIKPLSYRKKRLLLLQQRASKLDLGVSLSVVKSRLLKTQKDIYTFVDRMNSRSLGCVLKDVNSKYNTTKPHYKIVCPHSTEIVSLIDYRFKYVPEFSLDYILAETEDGKQLFINKYDIKIRNIMQRVPNIMGKRAKILWIQKDGQYYPNLTHILY